MQQHLIRTKDDRQVLWITQSEYDENTLPPTGFPTLQDALYDYLITTVGSPLIGGQYEVWLRAVVHILAEAQRDPSLLVVKLYQVWYESDTIEHAMIVSDNWTVLLPSTFAYALRSHRDYS